MSEATDTPDLSPDPTWRKVAEATREALAQLRFSVPACLPGEAEECGGSNAEHAAANLGALRAVVEYRITHLGPEAASLVDEVTARTWAELTAGSECDQGHDSDDLNSDGSFRYPVNHEPDRRSVRARARAAGINCGIPAAVVDKMLDRGLVLRPTEPRVTLRLVIDDGDTFHEVQS